LLCAHVDKLFDNHLITFIERNTRFSLNVNKNINTKVFARDQIENFKNYIEYHNQKFKDKNI